ncbi:MAG: hypothetical protein AW07_03674 [Candidatus Accumulibacter sp. SK-11]|nr:MAG: hypothetical protein AW07_03674 [Candidatus Accumulibacter sp. SK-11]
MRRRVDAEVVRYSSSLRSFLLTRTASASAPDSRSASQAIWACGVPCTGTSSH